MPSRLKILFVWGLLLSGCFGTLQAEGVAEAHFLKETAGAKRVIVKKLPPPGVKERLLIDSTDPKDVAALREVIVLVDPPVQFVGGEEVWVMPSFCCAEYAIEFVAPDGGKHAFLVKAGFSEILPETDALGLHDFTDIGLTKESQQELRGILICCSPIGEDRPLYRLADNLAFPSEYRKAALAVAEAVTKAGLHPDEYSAEVSYRDEGMVLDFELWHDSALKYRSQHDVLGDPSGGKCRTVLYDLGRGTVTRIYGWR